MLFLRLLSGLMIATSGGLAVIALSRWIIYNDVATTEFVKYLRNVAHSCTQLAGGCPHLATSHGLEEIASDLMAKAKQLEDSQLG